MRKEFARLMLEIGDKDDKLVVLVGDIGVFGLRDFWKKYPMRFYNIGVCEQSIISIASGISLSGLIPVAHSIAPFITERCFEQIKNDFCYQGIGGNIVSVGSCFDYAGLGCTHHTYSDIAILRSLPNTEIVYPASPKEFEILFKQTYNNKKLTYFRLPEKKHTLTLAEDRVKFGKGVLVKPGKDISVIVSGPQVDNVKKASELLKNKNIDIEIIYIHTILLMSTFTLSGAPAINTSSDFSGKEYFEPVSSHIILASLFIENSSSPPTLYIKDFPYNKILNNITTQSDT